MSAIVGYIGNREARQILVDCIGRLEDRDYDSAGIGTIAGGNLKTLRSIGNTAHLKTALKRSPLAGKIGAAHARSAVHHDASSTDVHPHMDCSDTIAVFFDGYIENYRDLKSSLEAEGHVFSSESESEVVAHLLERDSNALETAMRNTVAQLQGEFALLVLSQKEPDKVVAACSGFAPLVIGHHYDGYFIASDIRAIVNTRNIQMLEGGEIAVVTHGGVKLSKFDGTLVERPVKELPWDTADTAALGIPHYMMKDFKGRTGASGATAK